MIALRLLLNKENFPLIRRTVLLALAALLLAGALYAGARWTADWAAREHMHASAALAQAEDELAQARQSQSELQGNLARYRALADSGFVGEGDRLAWTEALVAAQRELGLPELQFELAARQPLVEAPAAAPVFGPSAPAPMHGPQAHDLRFAIAGIHEGELLALIAAVQARRLGHFRVEDCRLRRSEPDRGLDVDCTLRWITWLPASGDAS